MRSRSRSRPRIFNGRTRSKSLGKPRKAASVQSIGSDLSEQDQFDILVFKSANKSTDDRRSRTIFSYFTADIDASTVSSLTTDEYHYSYDNSAFPAPAAAATASATSWCCCSDTTQPTTTATVADYNTLVYHDGDDMDRDNMAGDTVAPPRRPRIKFGSYWRRKKSEMSPSLFDALQEEDPYNNNDAEPPVVRQQQPRRRSRSMSFFSKRGSSANKQ